MTHAGVVDDVLFWLVAGMALLLVMFIYAVITACTASELDAGSVSCGLAG